MIVNTIIYSIIILALTIASYTDLKTREVPDWLNYSLIIIGLSINLLASVTLNNLTYIINSLIGFIAFLILGYFMFYTGQWGGGDSKAMMGIGALLGFDISFRNFPFIISFFINMLLVGAIYGLLWSLYLAYKNSKKFKNYFLKMISTKSIKKYQVFGAIIFIIALISSSIVQDDILKVPIISIALMLIMTIYLWAFIKSVEKVCMIKFVQPSKLTEGDWILKEVIIDGKLITGPKDLGIGKNQIKQLIKYYNKGKVKKIGIKEGIPFVPSFLAAFLLTIALSYFAVTSDGNILFFIFS